MKLIYIFLSVCVLHSCNSQRKEHEQSHTEHSDEKKVIQEKCYRYASLTDTIMLNVIHNGDRITGTLDYSLKEKDKNKGTIEGTMNGNILVADYTFMSEGMQSIRQVVFKLEGNSYTEGYGDIVIENNKARFKELNSLKYNTSLQLNEIACQ